MRGREIAELDVRLSGDGLGLHGHLPVLQLLVHVLLKVTNLLLTLLTATLTLTHVVHTLTCLDARTGLAGGGGTADDLALPAAAAPAALCFEQVGVLGKVEAVTDEVKAEVERILLDHLAAPEARVVLELHPRIA